MANFTTRLTSWLPTRLRMFVRQLSVMVVAWLAMGGLIETLRTGNYPDPLILAGLIIGCALHAIFQPIPLAYRAATD